MEIITKNAKETFEFGRKFSTTVKGGTTLAMSGDLGSGKTTFTQGFGKGLGIERIISPTFILMRQYQVSDIKHHKNVKNFYHLDLYRLEEKVPQQLIDLGVNDFWGKKENIVLIEWAEKAKEVMPTGTIWLNFEYVDENSRKITINH